MQPADEVITSPQHLSRLRWQCRRGMLELDTMLLNFMQKAYFELDESQQQAFEKLLKTPDQELLEILMNRSKPLDKDVADVAQRVRNAVAA